MNRPVSSRVFRAALVAGGLMAVGLLPAASSMQMLPLDLSDASVTFTLDTTFHEVHGTMAVRESDIRFDPATRELSGRVVVDATTASTDNKRRDRRMHGQVLESDRYPDIVFHPTAFEGTLAPGESRIELIGAMEIHGASHEVRMPAEVRVSGDSIAGTATLTVPYVEWGMKDPSVLMFKASKEVVIELAFRGSVESHGLAWLAPEPVAGVASNQR